VSKGDWRRPASVPAKEHAENYCRTFGHRVLPGRETEFMAGEVIHCLTCARRLTLERGAWVAAAELCGCGSSYDIETGVCNRSGVLANHCPNRKEGA